MMHFFALVVASLYLLRKHMHPHNDHFDVCLFLLCVQQCVCIHV